MPPYIMPSASDPAVTGDAQASDSKQSLDTHVTTCRPDHSHRHWTTVNPTFKSFSAGLYFSANRLTNQSVIGMIARARSALGALRGAGVRLTSTSRCWSRSHRPLQRRVTERTAKHPVIQALESKVEESLKSHLGPHTTRAQAVKLIESLEQISRIPRAYSMMPALLRCWLLVTDPLLYLRGKPTFAMHLEHLVVTVRTVTITRILAIGQFRGFGSAQPPSTHDFVAHDSKTSAELTIFPSSDKSQHYMILQCLAVESTLAATAVWLIAGSGPITCAAAGVTAGAAEFASLYFAGGLLLPVVFNVYHITSSGGPSHFRMRTCEHEAGHFLIGYLYGLPISDIRIHGMLSWEYWMAERGHVIAPDISSQLSDRASDGELLKWGSMYMAGIAAESFRGHRDHGGSQDLQQIDELLRRCRPTWSVKDRRDFTVRAYLDARHLLIAHDPMFHRLISELHAGQGTFGACCAAVAAAFDKAGPDWAPLPRVTTPPVQYFSSRKPPGQLNTQVIAGKRRKGKDRSKRG